MSFSIHTDRGVSADRTTPLNAAHANDQVVANGVRLAEDSQQRSCDTVRDDVMRRVEDRRYAKEFDKQIYDNLLDRPFAIASQLLDNVVTHGELKVNQDCFSNAEHRQIVEYMHGKSDQLPSP
jgi:hypothetical protein